MRGLPTGKRWKLVVACFSMKFGSDEGSGDSWILAHVQTSHLTRDKATFTSANTHFDKICWLWNV